MGQPLFEKKAQATCERPSLIALSRSLLQKSRPRQGSPEKMLKSGEKRLEPLQGLKGLPLGARVGFLFVPALLAVLLPGHAHAYIGPGAGFAFLGSFFVFFLAFFFALLVILLIMIRVGLLGCGNVGRIIAKEHVGVKIAALHDLIPERQRRRRS
jgi:hypothetical protein